jgi:RimJ/RimL family protein N-acetyltransferase
MACARVSQDKRRGWPGAPPVITIGCPTGVKMTGSMLRIQLAQPQDEAFLSHSIEEAYREYPRLLARGDKSISEAAEHDLERVHDGFALLASKDEHLVGAAWWFADADPGNMTVAYYVEPEVRGQGIATQLLEQGFSEAKNRGMRCCTIKTHPDNAASIALAKKLGFDPVVALLRRSL